MCLADVGLVLRVDEPSATALVELGGRQVSVSLAPLVLTGVTTTAGDWMVVHTGLAVELLDSDEAGRIRAAREEMFQDDGGT